MATSSASQRLFTLGVLALALSLATLGGLELWRGAALPGLHTLLEVAGAAATRVVGALVLISALLLPVKPRFGAMFAAALWSAFFIAALIAASLNPRDVTGWVSAAECATFAAAGLACGRGANALLVLRLVMSATLLWFGVVHLTQRDLIASLIPGWMPFADMWPWATGSVLLVSGLACLVGRAVAWAAFVVALMFASWLVVVHAPRIAAAPASPFEWTFALTAAALTGAALMLASRFAETAPRR